ncbi:site-specific integrase, partial [Klebsiella pneumoniae]|nr:site-specific integrase [Klebsiella pneumoniae]
LYSGARLNEICQLHLEDVQDIDGVPCFRIEEEGSKKVKTVAGKRVVPVHPVLIELGFMRYVQMLREKGAKRLWENLKLKRDGYGQDFGKWYQRFNRRYITSHKKKVFHSFRHTVATAMK